MTQLFDRYELRYTAIIDLKSETSPVMTFTVVSPLLDDICQGTVSKINLLSCDPFTATTSQNGITTAVHHH